MIEHRFPTMNGAGPNGVRAIQGTVMDPEKKWGTIRQSRYATMKYLTI